MVYCGKHKKASKAAVPVVVYDIVPEADMISLLDIFSDSFLDQIPLDFKYASLVTLVQGYRNTINNFEPEKSIKAVSFLLKSVGITKERLQTLKYKSCGDSISTYIHTIIITIRNVRLHDTPIKEMAINEQKVFQQLQKYNLGTYDNIKAVYKDNGYFKHKIKLFYASLVVENGLLDKNSYFNAIPLLQTAASDFMNVATTPSLSNQFKNAIKLAFGALKAILDTLVELDGYRVMSDDEIQSLVPQYDNMLVINPKE